MKPRSARDFDYCRCQHQRQYHKRGHCTPPAHHTYEACGCSCKKFVQGGSRA